MIELAVASLIFMMGIAGLLAWLVQQAAMNESSRNLTWAMNDAGRVFEQLRQQNTSDTCLTPTVQPPGGASWNE